MMTKSMDFYRAIYKKEIVFFIYKDVLDDNLVEKILLEADINTNKKIGLDMKNIKSIKSKVFIDALKKDKFKLFNANSQILSYLSLVLKSGFLKTYINFEDFCLSKRELFKRTLYAIN